MMLLHYIEIFVFLRKKYEIDHDKYLRDVNYNEAKVF